MFYEYTSSGTYNGNGILPPSGWSPGDHIYFSIAVYPSKGELSYQFTDSSVGAALHYAVCNAGVSGRFSGNVGGLSEGFQSTGFGNIYVDQSALWAEVTSSNQRNSGNTYAYATSDAPNSVNITVVAANVFKVGFMSGGTHYRNGDSLWNGNFYATNENVPPDECQRSLLTADLIGE